MTLTPRLLGLLGRLARQQRDRRALDAHDANDRHRQARLTADALARFEAEQFARRRAATGHPSSVARLRIEQGFQKKLGQARDLQSKAVAAESLRADQAKAALLAEQRRAKALELLMQRREREALATAWKAELTESEELTARRHGVGPRN
jgi:flagellar biosynthesis chaperone FliJ